MQQEQRIESSISVRSEGSLHFAVKSLDFAPSALCGSKGLRKDEFPQLALTCTSSCNRVGVVLYFAHFCVHLPSCSLAQAGMLA